MAEPFAYLNGRFIPASHAVVSVFDAGFVQGSTVAEQLRTFNGIVFRLEAHVQRLMRSLEIIGVAPPATSDELAHAARELAARNHPLLAAGDDLGLAMFVTPGPHVPMVGITTAGPTLCMHTFPLRFELWAAKYREGQALATTEVEQVSPRCWPAELKCRSRMHYYLADRDARARYPLSRALMCDEDGYVTETTTANVVVYSAKRGLILPPADKILPGISLAVLLELADRADVRVTHRELTPDDVAAADEVFLTSTSMCMLPVSRLNDRPIGAACPGPAYQRFLAAWSELVGLDIVAQATRFASR
jgi:branched-subunit amino acid aminotransferase/4-amino-4-deoxychorismate lyase